MRNKSALSRSKLSTRPQLHPRNRHLAKKGASYDLAALSKVNPELQPYVLTNEHANRSINFADHKAVKELNRALLLHFYDLQFWDLPEQFLCPPVPGRVDYIHYLADLIADSTGLTNIKTKAITGLDIGTGANLIYPIVGSHEYQWRFVGSDIDKMSLDCAKNLIQFNPRLKSQVKLRMQTNSSAIFDGIIKQTERFTFSMCNPPFHESQQAAESGTNRKLKNLNKHKKQSVSNKSLNFGGRQNELWCEGGERQFVSNMIGESRAYKDQVLWFTSLVSKKDNLPFIYTELKKIKASQVKTIDMAQGNKTSRFVAWSFLTESEHQSWFK